MDLAVADVAAGRRLLAGGRGEGFGGGGGGRGGSARGGRGGGGGGAAAGPVVSPAAGQIQTVAPNSDNAAQVVATLTHNAGAPTDKPMVVTLWARDDQDFGRLASALVGYASSNVGQKGFDNGIVQTGPASQDKYVMTQAAQSADVRSATASRTRPKAAPGNLDGVQSVNVNGGVAGGGGVVQNGGNMANSPPLNFGAALVTNITLNNSGVIVMDQPRTVYYPNNGLSGNNRINQQADNRTNNEASTALVPASAPSGAGNSVALGNGNNESQLLGLFNDRGLQQAASQGGPLPGGFAAGPARRAFAEFPDGRAGAGR